MCVACCVDEAIKRAIAACETAFHQARQDSAFFGAGVTLASAPMRARAALVE